MAPVCAATFHDASVTTSVATLGQVADLGCLPAAYRVRLGALAVASARAGRSRLTLSVASLAARARAALPAAKPWFSAPSTSWVTIAFIEPARSAAAEDTATCVRVSTPVAMGATPVADDFAAAPCGDGAQDRPFRYDPGLGAVRTLRDLSVGEVTRLPAAALMSTSRPGEVLYVSTAVGSVRLERRVRTVQPSSARRAVFVQGEDGAVFSVPAPEIKR